MTRSTNKEKFPYFNIVLNTMEEVFKSMDIIKNGKHIKIILKFLYNIVLSFLILG